jgi:aryl-alcohol dehydrogenase-like predicted oxidoreductase
MERRRLGKTGLDVSPLAFGGNVFGWTVDEVESFRLLDAWVDEGFNFIDTADSYSNWVAGNKGGESETIIGKWLKQRGNRDEIIIATKLGSQLDQDKKGTSKKYMFAAVEASLKRLQTDYIDLYQSHWPDPDTPYQETLEGYATLIQQGKIRAFGCSNFSAQQLQDSITTSKTYSLPHYQTLQPLYNLYDRAVFEQELQQICIDNQIGVINYYALASGFLSGKYRTENDLAKSARGHGAKKYLNERGLRILDALDAVAFQYNCSNATIAIAWILTRPVITAPIASASSINQLKSLVKAVKLSLDNEAIQLLDKASAE